MPFLPPPASLALRSAEDVEALLRPHEAAGRDLTDLRAEIARLRDAQPAQPSFPALSPFAAFRAGQEPPGAPIAPPAAPPAPPPPAPPLAAQQTLPPPAPAPAPVETVDPLCWPPRPAEAIQALVLPRMTIPGFEFLDGEGKMISAKGYPVAPLPTMPIVDALASSHQSDAMLVAYGVLSTGGEPELAVPRLSKTVIPLLQEAKLIARPEQVVGNLLAIDVDNPNHEGWTETLWNDFQRLMRTIAAEGSGYLGQPSLWYATSSGCRFVWLLDRPVPVEGHGGLQDRLGGLIAVARLRGLEADLACRDWTRLFRLPRVVRADKPPAEADTQNQPYFRMSWGRVQVDATEHYPTTLIAHAPEIFPCLSELKLEDFERSEFGRIVAKAWAHLIGKEPRTSTVSMSQIPVPEMPTQADIQTKQIAFKTIQSTIKSQARSKLDWIAKAARDTYATLFEDNRLLYMDPERLEGLHGGILRTARDAIQSMGTALQARVDPGDVFRVLLHAAAEADKLRDVSQRRSFETLRTEVWSAFSYCLRMARWREQEREQDKSDQEALQLAKSLDQSRLGTMVANEIRDYLTERGFFESDEVATVWKDHVAKNLSRHLIVETTEGQRFVLRRFASGEICYLPANQSDPGTLVAIRDAGHTLIPYRKMSPSGEPVFMAIKDIMHDHAVLVPTVSNRLLPVGLVARERKGAPEVVFNQQCGQIRTDIVAEYHAEVDHYLRLLGGDLQERFLDWLACFHRIDRPLCGLYFKGAPSIGKSMFVLGLANMIEGGEPAPFHEALGSFQNTMYRTPLIWADEEAGPVNPMAARSSMNVFKKLITGEFDNLNRKSKDTLKMMGYWRVIFTANSYNLLQPDEEMNEQDLEALRLRLLYLKPYEKDAQAYLESLGGRDGTQDWPTHRIPAHVQWLRENRAVKTDKRFLIEGVGKGEGMDSLLGNSVPSEMLVEAIGELFTTNPAQRAQVLFPSEVVDGPKVEWYVTNQHSIFDLVRKRNEKNPGKLQLTNKALRAAFKTITSDAKTIRATKERPLPGGKGVLKAVPLRLDVILRMLRSWGYPWDLRSGMGSRCWMAHAPKDDALFAELIDQPPPPPPAPLPAPPSFAFGQPQQVQS